MEGLLKRIFKEERINSILVISVFLFFTIWWIAVYFGLDFKNHTANLVWSSSYHIIAVLGAYIAYYVYSQARKNEIPISARFILFVALGLTFQSIGQIIYSSYGFWLGVDAPYPSYGDIFFIAGISAYLVATIIFLKKIIHKKHLITVVIFTGIIFVALAYLEAVLLKSINYNFSWSLTGFMDFCYLFIDTLAASIMCSGLFVTRFFKNYSFRKAFIFICIGIILQFVADFLFTYWANQGLWLPTTFSDYIYLLTYFFVALGVVQFTRTFIAINILVVLFNTLFEIQLILAGSLIKLLSNIVILLACLFLSYLLLRRNKSEIAQKENLVRLAALEESHARLQELDKQKTEFLNIAAHQLRTPVSIIRNYISMVQDGDYGAVSPEIKGVLNNIYDSNQWLVRLADEFLDISRLESNQTKYHITPGDIGAVVREVANEINPKAVAKGLNLNWDNVSASLPAKFDIEKIRHVVLNFLENAIKYTPTGSINIMLASTGTGVSFTVTDTGLGFTPEDEEHFFQKFQRGNNAHEIEVNTSTGLGLYICRKFVEGHGGKVWAKSDGVGQGSEFGFYIPV